MKEKEEERQTQIPPHKAMIKCWTGREAKQWAIRHLI
jgi:hypothetical protein